MKFLNETKTRKTQLLGVILTVFLGPHFVFAGSPPEYELCRLACVRRGEGNYQYCSQVCGGPTNKIAAFGNFVIQVQSPSNHECKGGLAAAQAHANELCGGPSVTRINSRQCIRSAWNPDTNMEVLQVSYRCK